MGRAVGGRHTRHCNYTLCNSHARTSRAATSEISNSPGRPALKHVQATRGAAVTKIETKPSVLLCPQGALLGSSGPRPRDHALLHERRVQFLEFVIIEHVVAVGVKVCHHLV